jgi:hypothetical protein
VPIEPVPQLLDQPQIQPSPVMFSTSSTRPLRFGLRIMPRFSFAGVQRS